MKILRITLNNIASLAGLQTVDFTQEPLQAAGLYAISGDTGSGKSSLLDAMCLALYGKTPRLKSQKNSLEKINVDEQQLDPRSLLRRGTAEGMAEVAFIGVDGKKWTARWSVRRARKNVSGKLQHVERTLFEGHIEPGGEGTTESGGKKTEVDAAIQDKLGLTFDQFTRAVLLAQNEFAVFLQSDDKARAEILQALTGTRRFEDVSRAVYERAKLKRQELVELKAQLKGTSILPEDERTKKDAQLTELNQQLSDTQAKLKQLETEQGWHTKLEEHTKSLATTQAELTAATTAHTASQLRKDQLRFTQEALRHAAPKKQAVIEATAAMQQCEQDSKDAAEKRLQLEEAHKTISAEFASAKTKLKETQVQAEQLQPKLLEAAKLEETIRIKAADLKKTEKDLEEANKEAASKKGELQETTKQQKQAKKKQQELEQQQQKVQAFQPFADAADLWIERLKQAAETNRKTSDIDKEWKTQQRQFDQLQKQHDEDNQLCKTQHDARAKADEELQLAIALAQQFDRHTLIEQRSAADERRELWDGFHTYLKAVDNHQNDLTDCETQIQTFVSDIKQQDADLKQLLETDLPVAKQTVESQRASLQTVQSAISDEAIRLRTQLNDNQPCSVCGSVQHPYSAHPPSDDQTAVNALQQLLETAETKLQELIQKQNKREAERQANAARQQDLQKRQKQIQQQLADIEFANLDHPEIQSLNDLDISQRIIKTEQHRSEIAQQLKQLSDKEKRAATAEKAVEASRKSLEKIQQQELTAQQKAAESKEALSTFQADQNSRQQRLDELKIQQKNQLLPLQELFAHIPESEAEFESDSKAFQTHFAKSVNLVGSVTKQLSEIEAVLKQYSDKLETITPIATKAVAIQEERQKEVNAAQEQINELKERQTKLFDGKTAAEAQQESAKQSQLTEEQAQKAEEANAESQTSLTKAAEAIIQADKQKEKAKQKTAETTANLATWLNEFGDKNQLKLTDEQLDVMLGRDDEWLKSEQTALDNLAAAVQTKTGQLETLQTQHKAHLENRPSEQTLEEITELQQASLQRQQTLQQSKDEVQKALNVDDAQRKNNETVQQQIAKQEVAAGPWIRLNEVIGSADGSAFRNIAQRHTLDILLQFSNQQLGLLSGRYRLERISNSLNLMVVDQDMADERRSIHSLSGGESFLVSLALALGLASLTSNRLKIESLFIDEGFGSLDPNTLDLAMNALMQLESQGRKVGIISHVTAMTDAIPVQIKVKKGANGASTIDVPTITQVAEKPLAGNTTPTQQSLFVDPDSET